MVTDRGVATDAGEMNVRLSPAGPTLGMQDLLHFVSRSATARGF